MRVAKRIASFVLGTLLALVVALAGWIVIDRASTNGRVEQVANVRIDGPAGGVHAYRADPAGDGPHPAVVMIHEFWGLRRDIAGKADALAQEGYVVVAPDTFRGVSVDAVPAAIWNVVTARRERVDADLRAVVDALVADPSVDPRRIVVMGFCYGGGAALRYAPSDDRLAGTGVFYGTPLDDPDRLARLSGPLLGIFGAEDRQIPVAEVRAFEDALAAAEVPHEIHVFDGVGHAFVGSIDEIRAGGPPGRAWDTFLAWLAETVGGG